MKTEKVKKTRAALCGMYAAASQLGNRHLPTVNSDLRVAKVIRALGPIVEPINASRAKIPQRVLGDRKPEDMAPAERQLALLEIAAAQAAFDEELEECEIPAGALSLADLPKKSDKPDPTDEERRNASQLGALVADLQEIFPLDE